MIKVVNSKAELDETIKNNNQVVVDFYADWCGPCRMLGTLLEKIDTKDVVIVKASVENDELKEVFKTTGERSIPLMVKYINGEKVNQRLGPFSHQSAEEFILN